MCFDLSEHKVAALGKRLYTTWFKPLQLRLFIFFIQNTTANFRFSAYSHRIQILTFCVMEKFFKIIKNTVIFISLSFFFSFFLCKFQFQELFDVTVWRGLISLQWKTISIDVNVFFPLPQGQHQKKLLEAPSECSSQIKVNCVWISN